MIDNKKVWVIIGAAGTGKRMKAALPKQFLTIGGKTILASTVEKFLASPLTDEVVITASSDYVDKVEEILRDDGISSRVSVTEGGQERQDSIMKGLQFIKEKGCSEDDIVLVHDGVRPFVSEDLIERVVVTVWEKGAVIPGVMPKDTIRDRKQGTLDRSQLVLVQTPQGFRYGLLMKAYKKAMAQGFYGTDDAGLVERLGEKVEIVEGEYENIKITTPEDLKMENRIGHGYDVHRLVEGRKLILGGVEIPYEKGLDGHSDADVLIHALMDSMIGAAAMGDIGKLFPDTDDSYKGISSMILLDRVCQALRDKGFSFVNVDVTVICQRPKLLPYIDEMRKNISDALGIDIGRVSVKATTTEKLGFAGRGEGIAAEAVSLLSCRG